jgi:putative flippase GtrA
VRTGISGVIATAVDVCAMVLMVELLAMPVGVAAFLGAVLGAVTNFTLSKFWAFADPTPVDPKQVTTYALVSLGTALFVATSVHVLAVMVGVQYVLAKGIAAVLAFSVWSYPAQSKLVFRHSPRVPRTMP